MDLSVKLVLRAQAEGTSAIRAMREETSELAAAMKEVREAARSGGQVSPSSIKALGGFKEFQEAFGKAQKELLAPAKAVAGEVDEEKMFRGHIRRMDQMAKVRLAESKKVERSEAAGFKAFQAEQRREAEETLRLRQRLWTQQGREAEQEARAEAAAVERSEADQRRAAEETLRANMRYWAERGRAARETETQEARAAVREARQRREMLRGMGLGMFAGPAPEGEAHGRGGHGGRGLLSEFKTAAGYTLVYGGINKLLQGVGAVASSPLTVGRMTLGVAQRAREIKDLGAATKLTTNQVQELQYAFAAKGLDADKLPQTLLFLARSEIGAARGVKNNAVAFKALGVNVFDARHHLVGLEDLLYRTTDALHRQTNAAKADAISQMIFGRGVKDILPIIQGGAGELRALAREADKSGFVITPEDLERGELLAAQWSKLKLQVAGFRNVAATAAMPIVSDLLGEASGYLTSHRAEVTRTIRTDFAELKSDLPVIVSSIKTIADDTLAMSKNVGPFVNDLIRLGNSPIGRFMVSGKLFPGGADLGKGETFAPPAFFDAGTRPRLDDPHPEAHIHLHLAPGVAPPSISSRGVTVTTHRGQVQAGG